MAECVNVSHVAYTISEQDESNAERMVTHTKMKEVSGSEPRFKSVGPGWAGLPGGQSYGLLTCRISKTDPPLFFFKFLDFSSKFATIAVIGLWGICC